MVCLSKFFQSCIFQIIFSNFFFFFFQILSSCLPQILLDPFLNIFVSNIFERLPRFMFLHVSTVIVLVCAFIANSEHILRTKYSALISYFTCNFAQVLLQISFLVLIREKYIWVQKLARVFTLSFKDKFHPCLNKHFLLKYKLPWKKKWSSFYFCKLIMYINSLQ